MEDVVLHVRPSACEQLESLLQSTERLLKPFPLRAPPLFKPWFIAANQPLPIRPAKPAPIIKHTPHWLVSEGVAQTKNQSNDVQTAPTSRADGNPSLRSEADHSAVTRCWSVSRTRGDAAHVLPSKCFQRSLSIHRLHPLQRVMWVIGQHNCGTRTLEQVWRSLLRSVRASKMPTCNSNLQHGRAEIWVFCDATQAERVGHRLKKELQLIGRISLSVRRLGHIFSM
ncbi:shieldin complex subunit 3 [Gouania willdenowi]|uniref:Shieldin complex subunit 3-like n=1 Tax=Gouania willdenowi TaxID=441366 RepID=A0A8C5EI83_GOUWI|nr:shieldin complex subunit 3-like [Gouania willdenowi]